ncbi:sodium/potassium/calcium exchanger Nckx30C isoform X8 [Drosophila willistoni]|uniref:sodium/potassium/calcium exchanger Nckx30C isoform X8 n=1 Tax=Drosophila willistoni TaxID=7260 RepID=UPI000C26CA0F|nr:sodium/potassium/calcium exchanger Nckx30C isoform X8 [Drosophila willistoni]
MLQLTTCSKPEQQQEQQQQNEQPQKQFEPEQKEQQQWNVVVVNNYSNNNNNNDDNNKNLADLAKDTSATSAIMASATATSTVTASTLTSRSQLNNMLAKNIINKSTTIDFNSRRRRGRLRSTMEDAKCCQLVPAATLTANTHQQQPTEQTQQQSSSNTAMLIVKQSVNIFKRLVLLTLNATTTTTQIRTTTATEATANKITASPSSNSNSSSSCCCRRRRSRRRCCLQPAMLGIFLIFCLLNPQEIGVDSAKPKSAKHQPNTSNNNHNNIAGVAGGAGGGGGGGAPPTYQVEPSQQTSNEDEAELLYPFQSEEQMFDEEEMNLNAAHGPDEDNMANQRGINDTHNDNSTITKTPLFPKDLFTKEQLENGAVILHIIGVIYMFVALAIVCDEFFVPSLDVIIEKLGITDDVAGATFMAAGGSAPELFTSVIGVFVSFDDVGIGTIVGSAVFNILFVIGMCALFSKTVLSLTWWPLFRDCSFYSISLLVLIYFFRDNRIYWWEALILFTIYIAYVAFMKWNVQVEQCVKKMITKNKVTRVRSTDQLMPAGNAANSSETSMATQPGGSVTSRAASETRSGPPGSSNAAGATGKVDEKATQLHAIASLKVLLDATKPQRGGATTSAANHVKINLKETTLADRPNGNIDTTLDSPSLSGRRPSWIEQRVKIQTRKFSIKAPEIEDEPEPLSMAWPDTARKRLTYVLVAPLLVPMWLTLPDTRTPRGKRFFPVTFIGSIVWIAAFSYLMVWWANVAGDTARIPPEVMGLTFLAAGTSIPDLITSVIVARKGFGDMAVSSSVGSNIFDVTVGLPIPWLLYGIIYDAPVEVNSVGMVCSITILFMMLVFVVMSIACFRWRMNKGLGFTMFLLYFVFVAVSLMFEYDLITCPV